MVFHTLDNRYFHELKAEILGYPRTCGYYIMGLVAIPALPNDLLKRDKLLDALFQHFDDQDGLLLRKV